MANIHEIDTWPEIRPAAPAQMPEQVRKERIDDAVRTLLKRMYYHVGELVLVVMTEADDAMSRRYMLCTLGWQDASFDADAHELTITYGTYVTMSCPDDEKRGPLPGVGPLTLTADETASLLSGIPEIRDVGGVAGPGLWTGTVEIFVGDEEIIAWAAKDIGDRLPFVLAIDAAGETDLRRNSLMPTLVEQLVREYTRSLEALCTDRDMARRWMEDTRTTPTDEALVMRAKELRVTIKAIDELKRTIRLCGLPLPADPDPSRP